MLAKNIQLDDEFEDEGLYTLTFWLENDPPRYLCLARDDDEPDHIYIEMLDQKYGFETTITHTHYQLNNQFLTLYLDRELTFFPHKKQLTIELKQDTISAVTTKLRKIFAMANKS